MPSAARIASYDTTGCPKTELHQGTSCLSDWYTISLKFLKKIFGFYFPLLYIIIRCSFSTPLKNLEIYALRHVLKISYLREKKQKVNKKVLEVFGRYVLKQYFCIRFRERNADTVEILNKEKVLNWPTIEKNFFRKKLQKSFGSSKISFTFASAFRKKAVKEKSSLKDLDINKQVVQDYL